MTCSPLRRLFLALPAILLAAGCGAAFGPAAPTSTTADPVSTTTVPTTTTTVPPTTTTVAPFTAADGRNLAACADGTCEVFVRTGDSLPNAGGEGPVTITVKDGGISLGQEGLSLSGNPGEPEQINNQVFLIVAVQGDQGVLRLSLQ